MVRDDSSFNALLETMAAGRSQTIAPDLAEPVLNQRQETGVALLEISVLASGPLRSDRHEQDVGPEEGDVWQISPLQISHPQSSEETDRIQPRLGFDHSALRASQLQQLFNGSTLESLLNRRLDASQGESPVGVPLRQCGCPICQGMKLSQAGSTSPSSTGTNAIGSLLYPGLPRWNSAGPVGSPVTISFSFMNAVPTYYASSAGERDYFIPFNTNQRQAARQALNFWQQLTNIRFVEVADAGSGGQIRFGTADLEYSSAAHAYLPHPHPLGGDVWLNNSYSPNLVHSPGSYGLLTLIHEVGHALGLKHPGNYNAGGGGTEGPYLPSNQDSHQYSVMSYFNHPQMGSAYAQTPMLYDVAAIQYLYGRNNSTRNGNTTYTWDPRRNFVQTLWDGGGTDTISASNQTLSVRINLNPGQFSSIGPRYHNARAGAVNNLAIAAGVTIENAVGGAGHDWLFGNAVANSLAGESGNDVLSGNAGNDNLLGGAGNDTLNGGPGIDYLTGGLGNDVYGVDQGGDRVVETSTRPAEIDTVQASVSYSLPANVERLTLVGNGAIHGTGNALNNLLVGNAASNHLNGGAGRDILIGGLGNDTLVGGFGNDQLTGGGGGDRFVFMNAKQQADTITDFVAIDDSLMISAKGFRSVTDMNGSGLRAGAAIAATQFILGSTAADPLDRFIYNNQAGTLFFDPDGTGAIAATHLATLSTKPSITRSDIVVMA